MLGKTLPGKTESVNHINGLSPLGAPRPSRMSANNQGRPRGSVRIISDWCGFHVALNLFFFFKYGNNI